jgi:hypothetical protein
MPFFPRSRSSKDDRRRGDAGDAGRTISFEVESLEFVQAGDEVGLMRVAGHWFAPVHSALQDILMLVARGTETLSLTPLPDLNGVAPVASPAGELWRGAFTMPVEVAEDRRAELMLRAGEDVRVALPRVDEWARMQAERAEAEALEAQAEVFEAEAAALEAAEEPSLVDSLMARLQDVARMDDEPTEQPAPEPYAAPVAAVDSEPDLDDDVESHADLVRSELEAELELLRVQVQDARTELELERHRRKALDEEIRMRLAVEDDLRNAIAMQEAELASAAVEASQRARRDERRRDLPVEPPSGDHPEHPRSRPADEEFLARLERARRLSETASPQ